MKVSYITHRARTDAKTSRDNPGKGRICSIWIPEFGLVAKFCVRLLKGPVLAHIAEQESNRKFSREWNTIIRTLVLGILYVEQIFILFIINRRWL